MPPAMKKERVAVLHSVIREAAEKIGLNGDQLLRSIRDGDSKSAVDSIHNAGIRVAVRSAKYVDLFG